MTIKMWRVLAIMILAGLVSLGGVISDIGLAGIAKLQPAREKKGYLSSLGQPGDLV